jgi:hypothetical protein
MYVQFKLTLFYIHEIQQKLFLFFSTVVTIYNENYIMREVKMIIN